MREYREKVAQIRARAGAGAGGAGGGGGGDRASSLLPPLITQDQLKVYAPPRCSVWVSNTRNQFWGHCKPYKRVCISWAVNGEEAGKRSLLKKLWEQYLELTGEPASACPWAGLLD